MSMIALGPNGIIPAKSIRVSGSIDDVVRHFSIDVAENAGVIMPGDPIMITGSGVLMLQGYVNGINPSFTENSHDIAIAGRSITQDAADCSVVHKPGYFKNMTAQEIANELGKPVGVKYTTNMKLPKIPYFQVEVGEKINEVADRLAQTYGASLVCTGADEIMFWNAASATLLGVPLMEGIPPLKSASANISDDDTFSEYEVKSQIDNRSDKHAGQASEHAPKVKGGSTRYRPYVEVADTPSDKETAKKRAETTAKRKEGLQKQVEATIYGHFLGGLVEPGVKVHVTSPWLRIAQEMVISEVTWAFDDSGGTLTTFSCVPPETYDGKQSDAGAASSGGQTQSTSTSTTSASTNAFQGPSIKEIPTPPPGAKDLPAFNRAI